MVKLLKKKTTKQKTEDRQKDLERRLDIFLGRPTVKIDSSVNRLLHNLRHWQREPNNKVFLIQILLAYYECNLLELEKDLAEVLTFGARKYKPNNWRNCNDTGRYLAAAIRHGRAIIEGESTDSESGLKHKAHLATNLMFLFCLGYNS